MKITSRGGSTVLDRPLSSATTKRAQVRSILEQLIDTELHPGDAIPSERTLVTRLGVSRVTVRQAIADLVESRVLERVHGKGTYVTGPQVDSRLHLTSFSREMRDRGLVPATVVLAAAEEPADDDVAYALRIRPGRPVIRVERLRMADGTPMAYEVGHYPSMLFPGLLQRELGSLYDVFATEYGVVVTSGEQTVRAESADADRARILGIAEAGAVAGAGAGDPCGRAGDRAVHLLVPGRPLPHPHGDHAARRPRELTWPVAVSGGAGRPPPGGAYRRAPPPAPGRGLRSPRECR